MLRQYALNAAALRSWCDLVGHGQPPNKEDATNGEFRHLNAAHLHSEGYTVVPYHAGEALMAMRKGDMQQEGDAELVKLLANPESSFTTLPVYRQSELAGLTQQSPQYQLPRSFDLGKALIRGIQILQDGGRWVIWHERLPLKKIPKLLVENQPREGFETNLVNFNTNIDDLGRAIIYGDAPGVPLPYQAPQHGQQPQHPPPNNPELGA